jgi:hypothetical protein
MVVRGLAGTGGPLVRKAGLVHMVLVDYLPDLDVSVLLVALDWPCALVAFQEVFCRHAAAKAAAMESSFSSLTW